MKQFTAPLMEIQRLVQENIYTISGCLTEVLGCVSCYCSAVVCTSGYEPGMCTGTYDCGCYTDIWND